MLLCHLDEFNSIRFPSIIEFQNGLRRFNSMSKHKILAIFLSKAITAIVAKDFDNSRNLIVVIFKTTTVTYKIW